MVTDARLELRMLSEPHLIETVVKEMGPPNSACEVVAHGPVKDPTRLGFALADVAQVKFLIDVATLVGPFVPQLYRWLKNSKGKKVQLETPFRKVVIEARDDLTEDDVRKALETIRKF